MPRLGDDTISANEIQAVKTLCQDLGFDDTRSQHYFRVSVANWRKTYKTASGTSGTALRVWNSDVERYDLGVMAQRFVENGSNAHDFWPSEREPSSQDKPRYPKDEVTILHLLRRLMWRQNKSLAGKKRKSKDAVNDDRSGSEDYSPRIPPRTLQPSPQVLSTPTEDRFIDRDRLSYDAATGLRSKSVRWMGGLPVGDQNRLPAPQPFALQNSLLASTGNGLPVGDQNWDRLPAPQSFALQNSLLASTGNGLPVGDQNWDRLPAPQPFALQNSLLASTGNPSSFHLRSANSALMTGSSDMSPTRGYSGYSEENIQGQSLHQKRSYPHLLGSNHAENEFNKRSRKSMPSEVHDTSLQTPANTPSNFHSGVTNSTLTTGSSDIFLMRGNSGNSEEDIQGQSLQQRRPHPRLLDSNNVESESSKRNRISMPPELYSTALQTPTSDFDSSNDVNDQRIVPQENVGFSNWDDSQSQNLPSPKESDPPMTAKTDILTPAARPEVKILVVESSGPQTTIKKWPGGILRGRTLKSIFDEVSATFSAQTLQRIKFQLQALKKENGLECLIEREDDQVFEVMMRKFNERIKERKRAGETRFKLVLELDRGVQEATEEAVSEASGSEEDYL